MRERYEIETIEQLRAIADTLRIRIIDLLEKQPMTVTQLGERLGLAPAKVHYHVRELERVGLLELVETREKGGILEKYYQPIAHIINTNKALLAASVDEVQGALRNVLDQISDGYLQAFGRRFDEPKDETFEPGMISISHLHMTREEQRQAWNQIYEILKPFENRRETEGEKEILMALLSYPLASPPREQEKKAPPLKVNHVWVVGTVNYSRNDLLKVREEHRRLQISVIGLCRFASDVSATLVDEVVESFSLVGRLIAPPDIKEVLSYKDKHKEERS